MKHTLLILKLSCFATFFTFLFTSCHKLDTDGGIPNNLPQTSASADSISDHLQFTNATKKQGTIPQGSTSSSLKISFEDTLYLVDQIKIPIKFLHMDTIENVSGIFLQVMAEVGGSFASYYYDVPEATDLDSSDTVSVIMIGIDPLDFHPPLSFNIKIAPYDQNHNVIKEVIKPAKLVDHANNPKNKSACGLDNKLNETWDWVMSYREKSDFTSTPEKIWVADGQDIQGSCCGGFSIYGVCPGESKPNTHLHFNTFYQIAGEQITFYDGGKFDRRTVERGANPIPDSSDFCLPFEGLVRPYLNETLYHGTYTVMQVNVPPDIQQLGDSIGVQMNTQFTDPKGGGYGNGGGVIHYLDCQSLVLIAIDPEGFGQHLYKIYRSSIVEKWYEF